MIDISEIPFPDGAPEAGRCVRIERPEPGLAVVVLDPPHRKRTVIDVPLLRDLSASVDELEREPGLRGVVFTGRDPDQFAAGADVAAIERLTEPAQVRKLVLVVHELLRQIEALDARTVAAVGGAVPGGAFELSMSCDVIVATDDPSTRIGLPETQLGIVPAWGGCHRLPNRIGVPAALAAILTGKLYPAKQALALGMVDRLTKREYLCRVASDIAMGRESCRRASRGIWRFLVDRNPLARAVIAPQARKQTLAKTRGHYPAPIAAIELVTTAPGVPMPKAAEREADAVAGLAVGTVCKNLISIFFGMEDQKKLGRDADGGARRAVDRAGVIGAGVMGGAIAGTMAENGIAARLMDLSPDALDLAQVEHRAAVGKKLKRRRLARHEADAAIDRLEVTERIEGFARAQLVIEAVAEKLEVKRAVFGQLAGQVLDDAILATNTSSLSVDTLADGVPHPERVCGMHFFNPVRRMPLCEVVRGARTSPDVLGDVAALALRLGKTPIVVADCAGFLVNRILGPYLDEALRLFLGGADVERVDRLMLEFGMPMGPFALLDEVGFDIAQHAAASLHEAYGERMTPSAGLDKISGRERLGKKTGLGFYRHPGGKAKPVPADDLARFRTDDFARAIQDEQIVDRLVLSMANEAARCLEDQVVEGPGELDLATVLGTGFAPFRGGVLRFCDSLGLGVVRQRLLAIVGAPDVAARAGGIAKFTPAALIERLAAEGSSFHTGGCGPRVPSAPEPAPVPAGS